MHIADLSAAEQDSLPRVLAYWVAHWDWECPTLFGLEQSDFQWALDAWPESLMQQDQAAALAIVGGLRELLFGASAVQSDAVQNILGITYVEAAALLNRLLPRTNHALG